MKHQLRDVIDARESLLNKSLKTRATRLQKVFLCAADRGEEI